jgi:hypothetical protein
MLRLASRSRLFGVGICCVCCCVWWSDGGLWWVFIGDVCGFETICRDGGRTTVEEQAESSVITVENFVGSVECRLKGRFDCVVA